MNDKQTKKPANTPDNHDLREHYTFGLPLLLLMGVIAVVGIVGALVLKHYF